MRANLVAGDEVFGATNPSFINGYAELHYCGGEDSEAPAGQSV